MAKTMKDEYFEMLKGLVSWGLVEAFDEKLDKILTNILHGRKS